MQLVRAAGVALLGGLVSGAALATHPTIPDASLAAAYAGSAALLQYLLSVPCGVAAWGLCRLAGIGGGNEQRRRDLALAAALTTSILIPAGLVSLRWLHKDVLRDTTVLSIAGLGLTAAVGAALVALAVAFTVLAGRLPAGAFPRIATVGYAASLVALAATAFGALGGRAAPTQPAPTGPNLLLISVDSLRADVFYEYVAKHARQPLQEFVAGARRHRNAHTTFSHSLPSHSSMMSGLYPPEHGALFFKHFGSPLEDGVELLAERLAARGFQTTAILTNWWLGAPYGDQAGFGSFVNYGLPFALEFFDAKLAWDMSVVGSSLRWFTGPRHGMHENSRLFLRWLETRDRARPFFTFLHYLDMHPPNEPPDRYRERFCTGPHARLGGRRIEAMMEAHEVSERDRPAVLAQLRNLYLADMARMEDILEPVIVEILEGDALDDTLVFLVSDHGENLYERVDEYQKSHVYHTASRVPLLVRVPGADSGADSDALVSLVDIAPTAYAFLGVEAPDGLRGRDLLGEPPRRDGDWIYMQGWDNPNKDFARAVLFADGRKWIRDGAGRDELYDLDRDPDERANLVVRDPALAARYRDRFEAVVTPLQQGEVRPASPLARDR
jgi:arylsulfatase A-like enzyme